MATFLTTTGVSHHLTQMVNNATERLVLISPYLKINKQIKLALEDKNRMKIDIRIIFGKNELQPDEHNWLKSLDFLRLSFCENLHAKCYMSEKEAIITSMNLYDYSQVNNNEMGIRVVKDEDPQLYGSIYDEAQRLLRMSEEIRVSVEKSSIHCNEFPEASASVVKKPIETTQSKDTGFCIRCKKPVKLNPSTPYCYDCYKDWKKVGDEEHVEKYCHACGKDNKSSLSKPMDIMCYKKHKDLFIA